MDLGLKDRIAFVAASSRGLGRASAEAMARDGARVALCGRTESTLNATRDEMAEATGAEVIAIQADMSQADDIANAIQQTVDHFGGLHILVCNAGGPPAGFFPEFSDEDWAAAINLNLMSTVRLIRAALPHMQAAKWGRIINITSKTVKEPLENLVLSNSVRASIHGLSKTIADQIGADGITINNVMPGYIQTDRINSLAETMAERGGTTPKAVIDGMGSTVPLGRVGQPAEFGALVAFLASEQASYINGTSIPVDGGLIRAAF